MQIFLQDLGKQLAPFFLRLVFGIIFLTHGMLKFATLDKTTMFFNRLDIPFPTIVTPVIALLEICGGLMLILGFGWVTRIIALLLAFDMLGAIIIAKHDAGFVGGYEFELALLAGLVAIALNGPGRLSLIREEKSLSK